MFDDAVYSLPMAYSTPIDGGSELSHVQTTFMIERFSPLFLSTSIAGILIPSPSLTSHPMGADKPTNARLPRNSKERACVRAAAGRSSIEIEAFLPSQKRLFAYFLNSSSSEKSESERKSSERASHARSASRLSLNLTASLQQRHEHKQDSVGGRKHWTSLCGK